MTRPQPTVDYDKETATIKIGPTEKYNNRNKKLTIWSQQHI